MQIEVRCVMLDVPLIRNDIQSTLEKWRFALSTGASLSWTPVWRDGDLVQLANRHADATSAAMARDDTGNSNGIRPFDICVVTKNPHIATPQAAGIIVGRLLAF